MHHITVLRKKSKIRGSFQLECRNPFLQRLFGHITFKPTI